MDGVGADARWHRGGESSTPPLRWRHALADGQPSLAHGRETRVCRSRQLQTDDDYAVARSHKRAQTRGYQDESTVEDAPCSASPRSSLLFVTRATGPPLQPPVRPLTVGRSIPGWGLVPCRPAQR